MKPVIKTPRSPRLNGAGGLVSPTNAAASASSGRPVTPTGGTNGIGSAIARALSPGLASPRNGGTAPASLNAAPGAKFLLARDSVSSADSEKFVAWFKAGIPCTKYGRSGKPHPTTVHLSADLLHVSWNAGSKSIRTDTILDVVPGRKTKVFANNFPNKDKQKEDHDLEARCFSVLMDNRTLDLELTLTPTNPLFAGIVPPAGSGSGSSGDAKSSPLSAHVITAAVRSVRDGYVRALKHFHDYSLQLASGVPMNVKKLVHVNSKFEWSGQNLEQIFELRTKLGEGAFGEVWRAVHRSVSGMELAVKLIPAGNAEALADIQKEIDILQLCRNKFIVGYFGVWGPDSLNRLWILMDYCAAGSVITMIEAQPQPSAATIAAIVAAGGTTVAALTAAANANSAAATGGGSKKHKSGGTAGADLSAASAAATAANTLALASQFMLSEPQISFILYSSLMALVYLQSKNIIHRDVKARNILISGDGDVKLADFGVSKSLKHTDEKRLTDSGICGSPLWMSPEVCASKPASYQSDIWSLGITAIEISERKLPYEELSSAFRIMRSIQNNPPATLSSPHWSPAFRDFLSKCLVKEPTKRPNAIELLAHPFVAPTKAQPQNKSILKSLIDYQQRIVAVEAKAAAAAAASGGTPERAAASGGSGGSSSRNGSEEEKAKSGGSGIVDRIKGFFGDGSKKDSGGTPSSGGVAGRDSPFGGAAAGRRGSGSGADMPSPDAVNTFVAKPLPAATEGAGTFVHKHAKPPIHTNSTGSGTGNGAGRNSSNDKSTPPRANGTGGASTPTGAGTPSPAPSSRPSTGPASKPPTGGFDHFDAPDHESDTSAQRRASPAPGVESGPFSPILKVVTAEPPAPAFPLSAHPLVARRGSLPNLSSIVSPKGAVMATSITPKPPSVAAGANGAVPPRPPPRPLMRGNSISSVPSSPTAAQRRTATGSGDVPPSALSPSSSFRAMAAAAAAAGTSSALASSSTGSTRPPTPPLGGGLVVPPIPPRRMSFSNALSLLTPPSTGSNPVAATSPPGPTAVPPTAVTGSGTASANSTTSAPALTPTAVPTTQPVAPTPAVPSTTSPLMPPLAAVPSHSSPALAVLSAAATLAKPTPMLPQTTSTAEPTTSKQVKSLASPPVPAPVSVASEPARKPAAVAVPAPAPPASPQPSSFTFDANHASPSSVIRSSSPPPSGGDTNGAAPASAPASPPSTIQHPSAKATPNRSARKQKKKQNKKAKAAAAVAADADADDDPSHRTAAASDASDAGDAGSSDATNRSHSPSVSRISIAGPSSVQLHTAAAESDDTVVHGTHAHDDVDLNEEFDASTGSDASDRSVRPFKPPPKKHTNAAANAAASASAAPAVVAATVSVAPRTSTAPAAAVAVPTPAPVAASNVPDLASATAAVAATTRPPAPAATVPAVATPAPAPSPAPTAKPAAPVATPAAAAKAGGGGIHCSYRALLLIGVVLTLLIALLVGYVIHAHQLAAEAAALAEAANAAAAAATAAAAAAVPPPAMSADAFDSIVSTAADAIVSAPIVDAVVGGGDLPHDIHSVFY